MTCGLWDDQTCALQIEVASDQWPFWTYTYAVENKTKGNYVNKLDCGDYFTMCMYTKISGCIPYIQVLFVNYTSIKNKKTTLLKGCLLLCFIVKV